MDERTAVRSLSLLELLCIRPITTFCSCYRQLCPNGALTTTTNFYKPFKQYYDLRSRRHIRALPEHPTRLIDANFMYRVLYRNLY